MTEPEVMVWARLKNRQSGVKFRRQVPIGRFIVDFACFECRLVIEIDGKKHAPAEDRKRDAWLASRGWRVQRFRASDVYADLSAVVDAIYALVSRAAGPVSDRTVPDT